MSRAPSQPKGNAPISRDVVEVVKKKLAPPKGPPPAGMIANFQPKQYKANSANNTRNNRDYEENNDDSFDQQVDDDDYNDGDHREHYHNDRNSRNSSNNNYNRDAADEENDYHQNNRNSRRSSEDKHDNNNYQRDDSRYDTQNNERRSSENRSNSKHPKPSSNNRSQPKDDTSVLNKVNNNAADSKALINSNGNAVQAKQAQNQQTNKNKILYFNFEPILRATYRELKQFVSSPCVPGVITRCYIERNRSGVNMLSPFYSVCADLEDGTGRELMVCKKIMKSRTPHYVFSLKSEDLWRKREQRSRLYLGKLRATDNNEYVLYDNGICSAPDGDMMDEEDDDEEGDAQAKSASKGGSAGTNYKKDATPPEEVSLYRKELAVIHFNVKKRPPPNGVRGSEVCIPNNFADYYDNINNANVADGKGTNNSNNNGAKATAANVQNIVKPFEKIRDAGKQNEMYSKTCYILNERTTRYDPLSSCLVDFKGRANIPSVKNSQFVESSPVNPETSNPFPIKPDQEKDYLLQLGKTTEDCFNMDYRYPLSLLQAFAICIARFDANLSW
eukprot:gene6980-9541_t